MKIESYLEANKNNPNKIKNLQHLYDNWFNTGCILYNTMSEIVAISGNRGSDIFKKLDAIKEKAINAIENADNIGKTNPVMCETSYLSIKKRRG